MKRFLGIFAFLAAVALIDYGIYTTISQQTELPVSVSISIPDGVYGLATGITNIPITALASSTAARITRVEIYRDDILIATITNMAPTEVRNLQVTK